jgi:hypothetical protein
LKEDMRDIRLRLQALGVHRIELASISCQRGSEWHGTEADFALTRFLDYTGSLCNSPPPSLTGSSIILPCALESEICSPTDTLHLGEGEEFYNLKGNDDIAMTSTTNVDRHGTSGRRGVTVSIIRIWCNFCSLIAEEEQGRRV